ncbi:MAG: hypothetical protein AAFP69_19275 [Planctomycetota bacterium]
MLKWIFVINLCSTWYLVGLIWMVQIVHYALFDRVGTGVFTSYESDHQRLITPIVGPPMLVELFAAISMAIMLQGNTQSRLNAVCPSWLAWTLVAMIVGVWLCTFFVSVPYHGKLSSGFDIQNYRGLVHTNWIRTVLWTMRGIVLAYLTVRLLDSPPT